MFVFLESRKEIAKAHVKLEATFRREFPRRAHKDIGYPGGRVRDAWVHTDGHYWFWSRDRRGRQISNPRRLNWFGLFSERPGAGITVEINTAYEGRNDQTAGFFARDTNSGIVYLLHSGRVGGGTKGVGMNAFRAWSGESLIEVADSSGGSRDGLLVMPVEGVAASRSAIRYLDLVTRFKKAVRAGKIGTLAFQRKQKEFEDFYAEGRGRRKGRRSSEIDYVSRHGEVVEPPLIFANEDIVGSREDFSSYLKQELDDEIRPHWAYWDEALQACSAISTITFERDDFEREYAQRKSAKNDVTAAEALALLYRFSVIGYARRSGYGGSSWAFQYTDPEAGWDNVANRFKVHLGLKEYAKLRETRE
jgi:hypothetical protein